MNRIAKMLAATALTVASTLMSVTLDAQVKDTVNRDIREYNDEIGYYQIAHKDLGDPRFMFSDENGIIDFGIGGTVSVSSYMTVAGIVNYSSFLPGNIEVPTVNAPEYASNLSGSEIHAKARAKYMGNKLIAYIKLGTGAANAIYVRQAYISINGLSFGLIPSFFMDREAGVMTTNNGVSTRVDMAHILMGYSRQFGSHFSAGLAFEQSDLDASNYKSYAIGIDYDNQPMPDIAAFAKLRWDNGHVQLGGIYRNLTYWAFHEPAHTLNDGKDAHTPGWGLSLSGNIKPTRKLLISLQGVGGYGIAAYMPVFAGRFLDVGLVNEEHGPDEYNRLEGVPMISSMAGVQYNWLHFSSSVVAGYDHCFRSERLFNYDNFKSSVTVTANTFWNLSDYAYVGIEYLYGRKMIYPTLLGGNGGQHGNAHRLVGVIAFLF